MLWRQKSFEWSSLLYKSCDDKKVSNALAYYTKVVTTEKVSNNLAYYTKVVMNKNVSNALAYYTKVVITKNVSNALAYYTKVAMTKKFQTLSLIIQKFYSFWLGCCFIDIGYK